MLLMGSALASGKSLWDLARTGSVTYGGAFWHLLTETTPAAPCYQYLDTQTQDSEQELKWVKKALNIRSTKEASVELLHILRHKHLKIGLLCYSNDE